MTTAQAPKYQEESLRLAEELAAQWRAGIRVEGPYNGLRLAGATFLAWGQRWRAEEVWGEYREMTGRSGRPVNQIVSMSSDGILATLDGRPEDAVEIGYRIRARRDEHGLQELAPNHVHMAAGRTLLHLGRADELPVLASDHPFKFLVDVNQFTHFRQRSKAMQILKAVVVQRPHVGSDDD